MPRRPDPSDRYSPMTENELKGHVLRLAYANGWAVYHVPQATMRNGGGRGYPDLTLARDREVLWIELKATGGVLSAEQIQWSMALPVCHMVTPLDWYSGRVAELLS